MVSFFVATDNLPVTFQAGKAGYQTTEYRKNNLIRGGKTYEKDFNMWSGGSEIIPYTEERAKEWAVKHMDADDYMELFGAVEE